MFNENRKEQERFQCSCRGNEWGEFNSAKSLVQAGRAVRTGLCWSSQPLEACMGWGLQREKSCLRGKAVHGLCSSVSGPTVSDQPGAEAQVPRGPLVFSTLTLWKGSRPGIVVALCGPSQARGVQTTEEQCMTLPGLPSTNPARISSSAVSSSCSQYRVT